MPLEFQGRSLYIKELADLVEEELSRNSYVHKLQKVLMLMLIGYLRAPDMAGTLQKLAPITVDCCLPSERFSAIKVVL